jgi:nucleotide-binding universal stress UspA family protein
MRDDAGIALIAYDGSEDAAQAIQRAGALMGPRKAVVLHVWDSLAGLLLGTDIDGLTGPMREAAEELDSTDAQEAARVAEAGAEIARQAGLDATPRALRGLPKAWPAVLREAERIGAAVVVAGSRGLGGVKSALFGSVSSGLLHHSVRPLLVVPPADADADGEGDAPPGPVTIGYDGSEPAGHAIEAAAGLLSGRQAISTTIWTPYTPVAGAGAAGAPAAMIAEAAARLDEGIESAARRTADEGARLAADAGLEARAEARQATGTVWRSLIQAAGEHRSAAVVAGSRGHSAVGAALLGSVSTGLVHNAHVPVLVVPRLED